LIRPKGFKGPGDGMAGADPDQGYTVESHGQRCRPEGVGLKAVSWGASPLPRRVGALWPAFDDLDSSLEVTMTSNSARFRQFLEVLGSPGRQLAARMPRSRHPTPSRGFSKQNAGGLLYVEHGLEGRGDGGPPISFWTSRGLAAGLGAQALDRPDQTPWSIPRLCIFSLQDPGPKR